MQKLRLSLCSLVMLGVALGGLPACGEESDQDDQVVDGEEAWGRPAKPGSKPAKPGAGDKPATQQKDIVDTAVGAGQFSILAKALTDAKLVETLKGKGPFTVFAPTDAAFKALGEETLKSLTVEQLTTILTYHVVAAEVPSSAIKAGPVATVSGLTAFVSVADGKVKVNDATVTTADVEASNGAGLSNVL